MNENDNEAAVLLRVADLQAQGIRAEPYLLKDSAGHYTMYVVVAGRILPNPGEAMNIESTIAEPPAVQKVRMLLEQRVREYENGGSHTATFTIFNSHQYCFLRIGEKWAVLGHRYPTDNTTMDEMFDFNALGISKNREWYPSGFIHGNCINLAVALEGMGFLTAEDVKEFKQWSSRVTAAEHYARAKAQFDTAMRDDVK